MLVHKVWMNIATDGSPRELDPREGERPAMVGEVDQAKRYANEWAEKWFLPAEVEAWLSFHPWIGADLAANLQRNGISPEDAALLIQRGTVTVPDSRGLNIAKQINIGDLCVEAARQLLRDARNGGPK